MENIKNISRIDNDGKSNHAWFVTVQRKGEVIKKMFSDVALGGKKRALNAAIEFRNKVLADISEYECHIHMRSILRKNNTSGIPGVGRYETIQNVKTGRRVTYWMAFWDDENGKRGGRKFNVARYGEEEAKKMAVLLREEMIKKVCAAKCASEPPRC